MGAAESLRARTRPLVLIVEDHEDTRELQSEVLTEAGCDVHVVVDGNEAVAVALLILPDVIVMDLSMPGLDGWEATRLLRSYRRTRHIPIVWCSGLAYVADAPWARNSGCNYFVAKPCSADALKETVRLAAKQARTKAPRTDGLRLLRRAPKRATTRRKTSGGG